MTSPVAIARCSLYLDQEICDRYFQGLAAVVLQRRGDDLMILPVHHAAAGGYPLKRRNARGDRVVSAADFFRSQGFDDDTVIHPSIAWEAAAAGLIAGGVFAR